MANEVKLPRLGQGMESGTIVKWLKAEGESVEKGEPLYELDTDKVTQEVEAPASGVLLRIAVAEGEADVGATIGYIGEQGEDVPAGAAPAAPAAEPAASEAPEAESAAPAAQDAAPAASAEPAAQGTSLEGGRIKASPLARRMARERNIELAAIQGTGPDGRIVAEDVERAGAAGTAPAPAQAAASAAPAPAPVRQIPPGEVERVPLSNIRKTIARRLTEAWTAPAFQISMSADMSETIALRERLVDRAPEGTPKVSPSDFLTKACALALVRHRAMNARWADDAIELHGSADIGIAIAAPSGLVVPVVRGCEQRSLPELAAARMDIVSRARDGKLTNADLDGGTFTISNLGPFGVEQFVAVLNPPQAAILAVGAIQERPVVREGKVEIAPMLTLTLTCDHRTVDGALAAEFLGTVRAFLEEPGLML